MKQSSNALAAAATLSGASAKPGSAAAAAGGAGNAHGSGKGGKDGGGGAGGGACRTRSVLEKGALRRGGRGLLVPRRGGLLRGVARPREGHDFGCCWG